MSYKISDDCTSCGACEPECPNTAISQGDSTYVINAASCTECVGFNASPACVSVCPVEAPGPDANNVETEEQLLAKAKKLHPNKDYSGNIPSHFRA